MKIRYDAHPLSLTDFITLLRQGGWAITGGQERHPEASRTVEVDSVMAGEKSLIITTKPEDGLGVAYELVADTFTIRKLGPHLVQIHKLYPTVTKRPKLQGGGTHKIPLPGVALTFRNRSLEEAEKAKIAAAEAEKKREEENRRRQRIEKLGILGKTIVDVELNSSGHCVSHLVFSDGTRLPMDWPLPLYVR